MHLEITSDEKKILLLLQKYPNLFELENLDAIDLVSIEGIGSKTATQIKQHFINAKLIYKNIIQNKLFKGVLHTPTSKQNTVEYLKYVFLEHEIHCLFKN